MDDESNQSSNVAADTGTTAADSTPAETQAPAASPVQKDNGELILQPETAAEPDTEATDEAPAADDTKPEEDTQQTDDTTDLAPKSRNRFQQLANENREMRQELERLRQQEAQLATEQALLNEVNPETGDYYTPQEIERLAFAQSREQQAQDVATQRYELEVQDVQLQLRDEATRALSDFPMFDETSKDYDPALTAKVDALLGQNLVTEEGSGRIIGSRVSPYALYQTVYEAQQAGRTAGQINGQRATEKMLAQVDGTGSNQKGDVSFEKLSVDEMAARLRRAGHDV